MGAIDTLTCGGIPAILGDLPDTPAAKRLAEIIDLTRKGTPQAIADFIGSHLTLECANFAPIGRRIGSFMDWKARGGMDVIGISFSESHHIEATTRLPRTDERRTIAVIVNPEAPYQVEKLMLGRSPLPAISPPLDDQDAARAFIDYTALLEDLGLFSGAVLIARHGTILAQQAFGFANRDFEIPNNLETRFNVGSINKMWTAIALAQLVEAGTLSFDCPLSRFIDYPDAESAARIQIKHLLSHTSGLGCYFNENFDRTARHRLRSVDDFLALAKDQPPAFEPGTAWRYSNLGMIVAGKVLEVASGQSYFDYIQANVVAPSAMTNTGFFELDRVNKNLAVGYSERWDLGGVAIVNNTFEHVVRGGPAGGCYATAEDLFRFAESLKGGRFLSRQMVDTLTTGKPELNSPLYGYGFGIHPGRAFYGHSGGFPGISSNLEIFEDPSGWVMVILANDLAGMRPVALKARQLIGLTIPEPTDTQACLPTAYLRRR